MLFLDSIWLFKYNGMDFLRYKLDYKFLIIMNFINKEILIIV